jgi:hypothetical protein
MHPITQRRNLASNIRGGGANRPCALENFRNSQFRKRVKIGLNQSLIHTHTHTLLSPTLTLIFFICPLQGSSQKQKLLLRLQKHGGIPPSPAAVTPKLKRIRSLHSLADLSLSVTQVK